MMKNVLQLQEYDKYFWTENRVMFRYIADNTRAFTTFFANRVRVILENINFVQWKYILTKENHADDSFGCLNFKNITNTKTVV